MLYIRRDKHRIVVALDRFTDIFAANHPDPVRILEVATSHSDNYCQYRWDCGMASKITSTIQDVIYCSAYQELAQYNFVFPVLQ